MRFLLVLVTALLGGCAGFSRSEKSPEGTILPDRDIVNPAVNDAQAWRERFLQHALSPQSGYLGVEIDDGKDASGRPVMLLKKVLAGALKYSELKSGDLIYEIDGMPASVAVLQSRLKVSKPWTAMTWTYRRPQNAEAGEKAPLKVIEFMIQDRRAYKGPWHWEKGDIGKKPYDPEHTRLVRNKVRFLEPGESKRNEQIIGAMDQLHQVLDKYEMAVHHQAIGQHLTRAFRKKATHQINQDVQWAFQNPEKVDVLPSLLGARWWELSKLPKTKGLENLFGWGIFSLKQLGRSDEVLDRRGAWLMTRFLAGDSENKLADRDAIPVFHYGAVNSGRINHKKLILTEELLSVSRLSLPHGDLIKGAVLKEGLPESAVSGDYQSAYMTDYGWLVLGGKGDNRYDMSKLAAVVDPSGNDEYLFPKIDEALLVAEERHPGQEQIALHWIVDDAGDDIYRLDAPEDECVRYIGGPASGLGRVSGIVDKSGDDQYIGGKGSLGAGMLGIGVIVDMKGDDKYSAPAVTQGFGMYGLGFLIDLDGRDQYLSGGYAQGFGSTEGIGVLLDQKGHDFYQCNGHYPSVYGMNGLFLGAGQGVGFGPRPHDVGGIGLLLDGEGNDRYEGGEFSQGGGYFYGAGMLHDKKGNDYYSGARYSQAWSAHGGIGLLSDDAGDDTYVGQVAANQGAAWDESISLFIDRAGNDVYQGAWLSMGAAAMQSLAYFLDLGGEDVYRPAGTKSVMGESGGDSYHFKESKQYSFSVFMDAGKEKDLVPSFWRGKSVVKTGKANEKKPEDSTFWGLYWNPSE